MQQQTIETLRQALQESALPFAQQEPLASHTTALLRALASRWGGFAPLPSSRALQALPLPAASPAPSAGPCI